MSYSRYLPNTCFPDTVIPQKCTDSSVIMYKNSLPRPFLGVSISFLGFCAHVIKLRAFLSFNLSHIHFIHKPAQISLRGHGEKTSLSPTRATMGGDTGVQTQRSAWTSHSRVVKESQQTGIVKVLGVGNYADAVIPKNSSWCSRYTRMRTTLLCKQNNNINFYFQKHKRS